MSRSGEGRPEGSYGSSEALVLACVLSVAGLTLFLALGAAFSVWGGRIGGESDSSARGWFVGARLAVLALAAFSGVGVGRQLVRPSAKPIWSCAAGLTSMLLAMAVAALLVQNHIGTHWGDVFLAGFEPAASEAALLLALGTGGLLFSVLALAPVRSESFGEAAVALVCTGGVLLLSLLAWAWGRVSRMGTGGPISTGSLPDAPIWFAVLTAAAIPMTMLAFLVSRKRSLRRDRNPVRAALGVVLLVGLSGLGLWNIANDADLSWGGGNRARRLIEAVGWIAALHAWAILSLALLDLAYRISRARGRVPDRRISVVMHWIGHSMAGVALLFVAGGLDSVVGVVLRYRTALTPKDLTPLFGAGTAVVLCGPLFLAARLLAAPHPVSAVCRGLRRSGLVVLVLGVLGLQVASARLWTEFEAPGLAYEAIEWLRTGATFLLVGAIAFLVLTTNAAIWEFVRLGRPAR